MNSIRFLVYAVLVCSAALANAEDFCELPPCDGIPARTFSGKVIAVMDGDTLLVIRGGHTVKIRLAEVDAPEKAQPFGSESRQSLVEMVMGKQVRVVSRAVDDYQRLVAIVYAGEIAVNHEQVRRGMAWEYSRFHSNRELMALQHEAQQARRGLWAGKDHVEPSLWRKQHPVAFAAQSPAAAASAAAPVALASDGSDQRAGSAQALQQDSGQACGRKHCPEIKTCEEAERYLSQCGQKALDGDADGKPCESLCVATRNKSGMDK